MKNFKSNASLFDEDILTKNAYDLKDYGKGDKLPIVSDTMFNVMLNNEKRKEYVSALLEQIISLDYEYIYNNIVFIKNKLDQEKYYDSKKTVDLVCEIDNVLYNLEMNNTKDKVNLFRNMVYAVKLFDSLNKRGTKKYIYVKTIQINFNNFYFKSCNETIQHVKLTDIKDGKVITNYLEFINIYLPLIREKMYNKEKLTKLEEMLLIFNEKDNKLLKELSKGDEIMEEYVKDAYDASQDEEIIGLYDKELHEERLKNTLIENAEQRGIEQGLEQGLEQGIEQGIKQGYSNGSYEKSLEVAKNMLKDGLDIDKIIMYTGLSKEEIQNLHTQK